MAGTLSDYIFADDREQFIGAAHHEVAHALRAHSLGVEVKAIYLSEFHFGRNCVNLTGDASLHGPDTHVQIPIAGPAATRRFILENEIRIFFREPGVVFREQEDDADLVNAIHEMEWTHDGNPVEFHNLTVDIFPECQLGGAEALDDFDQIFETLMIAHYNRYGRLPRISTLLRHYRRHEQIINDWVDVNWKLICKLAEFVLHNEKRTTRYTHFLPGPKFRKFLQSVDMAAFHATEHRMKQ